MRRWGRAGDPSPTDHALQVELAGSRWIIDPGEPKPPARYCVAAWIDGARVIRSAGDTVAAALLVAANMYDQGATVMAVLDRDTGEVVHQTLSPDHLPGYCVSFRDQLRSMGSRPWRSRGGGDKPVG